MHSPQCVDVIQVTLRLRLGYGKQLGLGDFLSKIDRIRQCRAII